ncbi:MAG: acyltransferase family protein [Myxococcota bacterium]
MDLNDVGALASEKMRGLERRKDIDGLRAIAILSIVAYHFFPSVKGGFIGVDIFFVISGFLITGVILRDLEAGTFSYKNFYARRIKRIFPALILVLGTALLCGYIFLIPAEFFELSRYLLGGSSFSANLIQWQEAGYFDMDARMKPLHHLWSLAIEEQFYILWPLLLVLGCQKRKLCGWIVLILACLSFGSNLLLVSAHPITTFYLLPFRAFELMIGAMLVLFPFSFLSNILSLLGVATIAAGLMLIDNTKPFPGWWALLPCLGTALVISAGEKAWLNRNILSAPFMVCIGLISYPLYLWHWPIYSFSFLYEDGQPSHAIRFLLVALSFALAILTYIFLERPLKSFPNLYSFPLSGAMAAMLCLSFLPRYLSVNSKNLIQRRNYDSCKTLMDYSDEQGFRKYSNRNTAQGILYLGDSHMHQYCPRIAQISTNHKIVFAVAWGCLLAKDIKRKISATWDRDSFMRCQALNSQLPAFAQDSSFKTVVVAGFWNRYFSTEISEYYKEQNGISRPFNRDSLDIMLSELFTTLVEIQRTKKVILVLDHPPRRQDKDINAARQFSIKTKMIALAHRYHISVIDPTEHLCPNGKCQLADKDSSQIYRDNNHLDSIYVQKHATFMDHTVQ